MPASQSAYLDELVIGRHGQVANPSTCIIDSYILTGTTDVEFGTMVYLDGATGVNCDQAAANAANYLGVAVQDPTRDPSASDEYRPGDSVSVLRMGEVYLTVPSAVNAGNNVSFVNASGILSSAAGGTAVVQARWKTSAAANGVAILSMGNPLTAS